MLQENSSDFAVMPNLYYNIARRGTKYWTTCFLVAVRDDGVRIQIIRPIQILCYYEE